MTDITKCNKICVMGVSGSGKSFLATKLGKTLDLPVIHFDKYLWQAGWVKTDKETFRKKILEMMGDKWVTDGNHTGDEELLTLRFTKCDAVILLDISEAECIKNVTNRHGKKRDDLPECLTEDRTGLEGLIEHIKIWNLDVKPKIFSMVDKYAKEKFFHVKSRAELNSFIKKISNTKI